MTLKCPECGWEYDPDNHQTVRVLNADDKKMFHELVPCHRSQFESSLDCDGTHMTPLPINLSDKRETKATHGNAEGA